MKNNIFKINLNKKYLNKAYKPNLNVCAYHIGTTDNHSNAIWKIFKYLRKQGYSVVTEAIFSSGGRADLFILDNCKSIEVMESEKENSIELKKHYYPKEIISVKATEVLNTPDEELYKLID